MRIQRARGAMDPLAAAKGEILSYVTSWGCGTHAKLHGARDVGYLELLQHLGVERGSFAQATIDAALRSLLAERALFAAGPALVGPGVAYRPLRRADRAEPI